MENLIFDRTQLDVDKNTAKGKYNYNDLNRIENWCKYLADTLNSYSYKVNITTKTDWTMKDKGKEIGDMERIRSNVNMLKQTFCAFTNIPDNLKKMTWQKANDIEKILYEINELVENMIVSFYYSNTFYSGESEGLVI